jgi:glycosyltransferase involved in cell wall biosynthesis
VVVPTFKRPDLVRRAVHSALRQDYTNLEAVVVGDHCPDLKVRSYGRLRVFNLPKNHGAGGATPRNYAMILAAGALIGYVDDDNALAPDHISSLYEALRLSGKAWAFSSMQVDGKDLKFDEPREKRIDTSCLLHPKGFVAKYGLWKSRAEAGTYAHDWEFVQRWLAGGESWICTRKPTLIYNAETSGQAEFLKRLVEA